MLVTKIRKDGVSRTIGSEFGFGSFTIGATSIEIDIDPPIDMDTDEGKIKFKEMHNRLARICTKALENDVDYLSERNKELRMSKKKREDLVDSIDT